MISAVILTKDEETNIKRCLESVSWCDEKIVIDDYSQDQTTKTAKSQGAKVYLRHLNDDFAGQRNYGLSCAKGEWVLFIDADEEVSENLAKEIKQIVGKREFSGFYIKRQDWFGERWLKHGDRPKNDLGGGLIKLLRLGRAGEWKGRVHEVWVIEGDIGELKSPLFHYPHQTITEFIKSVDYFSTLQAKSFYEEGKRSSLGQIIFYPLGKFIQNYILRGGFLDGMPGFVTAMMMSLHSFLVRGKLWLK